MKSFKITLFFIFLAGSVFSGTFYIAPGISYSKLEMVYDFGYTEVSPYKDPLISFSFETGFNYFEQKNYSLSSELLFYESGGKILSLSNSINAHPYSNYYSTRASVKYISFGNYINFSPLNKLLEVSFQLGPRVDYILSGKNNTTFDWINRSGFLSTTNFGITSGVGVFIHSNSMKLGINAQYLHKFIKLVDKKQGSSLTINPDFPDVEAKETNYLVNLVLGFKF